MHCCLLHQLVSGSYLNMGLSPSVMANMVPLSILLEPGLEFLKMGPGKGSPVQDSILMPISMCKLYSCSSAACKPDLSWSTTRTTRASYPFSGFLSHLFSRKRRPPMMRASISGRAFLCQSCYRVCDTIAWHASAHATLLVKLCEPP